MKGMFLLSTIAHLVFLMVAAYMPKWTHKDVVYTPVYTVDLLALPQPEGPSSSQPGEMEASKKKETQTQAAPPSPKTERKPLQFTPPRPDDNILKDLEQFEKKVEEKKKPEKKTKEIKEAALSEMLTAFEKKWDKKKPQKKSETKSIEEAKQKDLLEELKKLEEQWDSAQTEQKGEKEGADKSAEKSDNQMKLRQAGLRSQTSAPVVSSALNSYYGQVLSRIHENWINPLSKKTKDSGKDVPGVVYFKILASGEVVAVRIEQTSGDELLDILIKNAIIKSSPLPPPPREATDDNLEVFLDFKYIFQK
ncbi:MAG: cell envelope integrity protein TolA [Nitrospinae bacterium]|nr:cell envelope integrity protein TolA [Nitrospinota bacterium]